MLVCAGEDGLAEPPRSVSNGPYICFFSSRASLICVFRIDLQEQRDPNFSALLASVS